MNTILVSGSNVEVNVSVYLYLDTSYPSPNMWIAYCPSLNVVGYGYGQEAAKKDFEFVLNQYLAEQLKNHTLEEDLHHFGWHKSHNSFDEPKATTLASRDKVFSDVLNAPSYSKINVATTIPAFA